MKTTHIFFSFLFAVTVINSSNVLATEGGSGVGNGDGIAEQNFVFAYMNLPKYVVYCLSTQACKLTAVEKNILTSISNNLPLEMNASGNDQLEFKSEKGSPGFFNTGSPDRIAKTSDNVGSKIFINSDLLYPKDNKGNVISLDIPTAVAILVHELGHHQNVKDHLLLDTLGNKIRDLILGQQEHVTMGAFAPHLSVTSLWMPPFERFTQLILSDGEKNMDLSARLKVLAECPNSIGYLEFVYLRNLHWGALKADEDGNYTLPIKGDLFFSCKLPGGRVSAVMSYEVTIMTWLKQSGVKFVFDNRAAHLSVSKDNCVQIELQTEFKGASFSGNILTLSSGTWLTQSFLTYEVKFFVELLKGDLVHIKAQYYPLSEDLHEGKLVGTLEIKTPLNSTAQAKQASSEGNIGLLVTVTKP